MKVMTLLALLMPAVAIGLYLIMDDRQMASSNIAMQAATESSSEPVQAVSATQSLPTVEDMLGRLEARLEREPDDARGWDLLGKSYEFLGRHEDARKAFERAKSLGYESGGPAAVPVAATVKGVIALDPALVGSVSPTDTVYVFARPINGPPMPVAVLRRLASELPFEFELDDSSAMSPEAPLSAFGQVIVGARISSSGDASPSDGDLEGFSDVVTVGDKDEVMVMIAHTVIN